MRLLLDECVPRRLASEFVGHEVLTVPQAGWAGLNNGELLVRAAPEFDAFITTDRGIEFQQNLTSYSLAIVLLLAPSNDIDDLRPLVANALPLLESARPGVVTKVAV